ncbi:MAG: cupin domain-containing protein [Bradymonadaceae bacterium]|nr:cupin domain-containing protein [Lujinxingiaceae bacterium]
MEPRISLITLGVKNLEQAVAFYRDGLGLPLEGSLELVHEQGVAFFGLNPQLRLGLFPWAELAVDAQLTQEGSGFRGISIAHNVRSREQCDEVIEQALAAGATLRKGAEDTFWGGYAGYFEDPDGHLWEVAWNPFDSIVTGDGEHAKRQLASATRPDCILHWQEIQDADNAHYPNSDELLSIGSAFGRRFGLTRLGIHHELLPPGRRTSWPHAESGEEEFVYVIEGRPHVWLDGHLHALEPGDAVGFVAGTGLAHTFINNSDEPVRLLVVGDTNRDDNLCTYPLDRARNQEIGDFHWDDVPARELGPHDGMPDRLRDD